MTAPQLAEGFPTFEERAGGDFLIVKWPNGASIMLSRHDAYATGRNLQDEASRNFASQPARIVPFPMASVQ